jgi:exodeoxyribonuclease-3
MKIISFNVNGIRAIAQKTFIEDMRKVDADIICLQETRVQADCDVALLKQFKKYYKFIYLNSNTSSIKSYSGVAIFSKIKIEKDSNK